MPVDYDRWHKNQIDLGNLPDENDYYHYTLNENEPITEHRLAIGESYVEV